MRAFYKKFLRWLEDRTWSGFLLGVCVIFGLVVVGLLLFSSYKLSCYPDEYYKARLINDTLYEYNKDEAIERLSTIDKSHNYDSIIAVVVENQYAILKRQEDLVNDIRQETNNNIDKVNELIAFSIGILSLFGVIIPLTMQYKAQHYAKERIQELKDRDKEWKESLEKELGYIGKDIMLKSTGLKETRKELDLLVYFSRLSCIVQNTDFRTIPELGEANAVAKKMWDESTRDFEKIKETIFKKPDCEESRVHLLDCLTQIITTLNVIRVNIKDRQSRRAMDTVTDKARKLIHEINGNHYESWEKLREVINELIAKMRRVEF